MNTAIYGSNGGRFGEAPLTEKEYKAQARRFRDLKRQGYEYTTIHGDHRLYRKGPSHATSYGEHFDRRVIERMVDEGLLSASDVEIDRVIACEGLWEQS